MPKVFQYVEIMDAEGKSYSLTFEEKDFASGNDGYWTGGKITHGSDSYQVSMTITRIAKCANCGKARGGHPWSRADKGCNNFVERGRKAVPVHPTANGQAAEDLG